MGVGLYTSKAYHEAFYDRMSLGMGIPLLGSQRRFLRGLEWNERREVVGVRLDLSCMDCSGDAVRAAIERVIPAFPMLAAQVGWDGGTPYIMPSQEAAVDFRVVRAERCAEIEASARVRAEQGMSPVSATLVESRVRRTLLLFIDHLRVDLQSFHTVIGAIMSSLAGRPVRPQHDWEDARRVALQLLDDEAIASEDVPYWKARLRGIEVDRGAPTRLGPNALKAPVSSAVDLPGTNGMFGRLLYALHQAMLYVDVRPALVGYAWGFRPDYAAKQVTCLMNTVPSPPIGRIDFSDFRAQLWDDFEHAAVPYDDIVHHFNLATRTGWSGAVDAWLAVESPIASSMRGATIEPLRLLPLKAPVVAVARREDGKRVSLKLVATDKERASRLMAAWVDWITETGKE